VFLVGFLVVLIAGDPGLINRERRWLRSTTEVMIVLITLANAVSAVRLVADILTRGSSNRRSAATIPASLVLAGLERTQASLAWSRQNGLL
jgi:hypothetical protein